MVATVSIVATVFNESTSIARLLDSLSRQTRHPDEIVITDGGSNDGTLDILKRCAQQGTLPLSVYACPGSSIAQGRNKAIQAARGEIIAVTDAGVNLEPNWLEELVRPFDLDPALQVVSGFFLPDPHTPFEIAMGATVLPQLADIDPKTFLPSSRSIAFRKTAWQEIGGYPEWLDYCEDLILDLDLRTHYGTFAFAPLALVHFRPRPDLRSFFVQYYRYARGDGKADLWRKRHAIRYFTYIVALPVLLLLTFRHSPWWLLGLLGGAALYTAVPYRRLRSMTGNLPLHQRLYAIAMVPLIRVVGDIAKMIGYPVGWVWRLRHWQTIPR
jgi:glycosyltransferase involved in cell wall biosynthesis